MIVCVCRRVTDRDIEHHAQSGCTSLDELQMETGLGTCCGRCTDCASEVLHRAQRTTVCHLHAEGTEMALT